ncbi:uncharacterized protein N7446_012587 [Penicillium canescens]|uniref:uncharacterized protein n=1 Tax=Penicillium canescens TaxID=5083 RepID=UPI0026DF5514|nr:uncharacterized protein N7446_012587 [Penicillium canescens]KAJ6045723.1 hypothetical protein N7446_012587 [Penicillium canescens]KAJ6175141.1 hypothetical protein N7485_004946 [Penicillium canescens]
MFQEYVTESTGTIIIVAATLHPKKTMEQSLKASDWTCTAAGENPFPCGPKVRVPCSIKFHGTD